MMLSDFWWTFHMWIHSAQQIMVDKHWLLIGFFHYCRQKNKCEDKSNGGTSILYHGEFRSAIVRRKSPIWRRQKTAESACTFSRYMKNPVKIPKAVTGCLSAKGDVSINPDREKYLVCCQFSKLFMFLNSGNFGQINFLRFLLPLAASTASNRKGAKICKNHGFLSKTIHKKWFFWCQE